MAKEPVPVPVEVPENPPEIAALSEPTPRFIAEVCKAIRAGTEAETAARWNGCEPRMWKKWWRRRGEIYDTMRTRVVEAVNHRDVKFNLDVAKKSPAASLKRLGDESLDYIQQVEKMSRENVAERLGLTFLEQMFARALTAADNPEENATKALRKIGVDKPANVLNSLAYDLRNRPRVKAYINRLRRRRVARVERKLRLQVTGDKVLEHWAKIGFAKIPKAVTVDEKMEALRFLAEYLNLVTPGMPIGAGGLAQVNIYQNARVELPDNGRDKLIAVGGPNGTTGTAHRTTPVATIEFPARDDESDGNDGHGGHDDGNNGDEQQST